MKINEIRDLEDTELKKRIVAKHEDLFRLRIRHFTNQLEQSHSLKKGKRDIARMMTVLRERELGIERAKKKSPVETPKKVTKKKVKKK